jgi:hypothetical protein
MIILSQLKQLEILKTILVNIFLMVFQNQPMLGNVQLNAGRPKGVWLLANVVISFPFVALIS